MKSINKDVWLALGVIALAGAYLIMDMRLPEVRLSDPLGPKVFPALVGIGLIVSALLLLRETAANRHERSPRVAEPPAAKSSDAPAVPDYSQTEQNEQAEQSKHHAFVLVGMLVWTGAYYACFERLGYLVSTTGFLFGLLAYFNRKRLKTNLAIALGVTVVLDLLFAQLLGVPMPTGLLPF
ncbi:tripartite tricarboxylate transporter TctB family protein [Trinickia dinghuensis]|uniref:Tripartite tricarboxylate transporter TctB family protein n=1 Tax=Trinickia dinghuensis TaxID=2291023 RepID=A0A3D8K0X3_9BURK|nr:tripartite tricarboxylate transporter TctB family protein [Trinickia dinghuensis]RDU98544.1 tripartite tricarboxylate transporter TctB family protein [Trinickia dinghuensis]